MAVLAVGDYRVLRDARAVLFTSEEERLQARRSFWLYTAHERVVAYGTSTPPDNVEALREVYLAANPQLRGRRVLLFLGRIQEKRDATCWFAPLPRWQRSTARDCPDWRRASPV